MTQFVSNRREIKYLISRYQLSQFDALVRPILELDPNNPNDKGYYNHSIYFDSPGLLFLREKDEGLNKRIKPRLRAYKSNIDDPPDIYFFEFKRRNNRFIGKQRLAIARGTAERLIAGSKLSYDDLANSPLLAEFQYLQNRHNLSPQVGVLYNRRAYSIPFHHRLRITYDTQLQCSRTATLTVHPGEFEHFESPRNLVLEIKYNGRAPRWLLNICSRLEFHRVSYSKYAKAVKHAYRGATVCRRLQP